MGIEYGYWWRWVGINGAPQRIGIIIQSVTINSTILVYVGKLTNKMALVLILWYPK